MTGVVRAGAGNNRGTIANFFDNRTIQFNVFVICQRRDLSRSASNDESVASIIDEVLRELSRCGQVEVSVMSERSNHCGQYGTKTRAISVLHNLRLRDFLVARKLQV